MTASEDHLGFISPELTTFRYSLTPTVATYPDPSDASFDGHPAGYNLGPRTLIADVGRAAVDDSVQKVMVILQSICITNDNLDDRGDWTILFFNASFSGGGTNVTDKTAFTFGSGAADEKLVGKVNIKPYMWEVLGNRQIATIGPLGLPMDTDQSANDLWAMIVTNAATGYTSGQQVNITMTFSRN